MTTPGAPWNPSDEPGRGHEPEPGPVQGNPYAPPPPAADGAHAPSPSAYPSPPGYGAPNYGAPPGYGAPGYGAPPPGYGPSLGHPPMYPPIARTSGLAVASMVTSIAGIATCGLGGLVGLVLGIFALSRIKRDGTAGRGMAIAGIVVGAVFVAFFVLAVVGLAQFSADGWDSGPSTYTGIDT